jgi:hypothetical protein
MTKLNILAVFLLRMSEDGKIGVYDRVTGGNESVVVLVAAAWVLISEAGRSGLICRCTDLRHGESRDLSLNPSKPRNVPLIATSTMERYASLHQSMRETVIVYHHCLIGVGWNDWSETQLDASHSPRTVSTPTRTDTYRYPTYPLSSRTR